MDTDGKFYLGRLVDSQTGETTTQPLLYDPADLLTHAVVVGMTGSGKTGLCINLLEEAALGGIPAFMVDPKGDITNALLHFPGLAPQDFLPWVNADQARRDGMTVEEAASQAAAAWRAGLAEWEITPERLQALKNAAGFTVYTPGSSSGVPVSILSTFRAPLIPWEANREQLREKISGTVTALMGLVGMDEIDPVRSREHILLANIFEHAWSQGKDMDLGELILQTQTPPFARLGVFDVNTFFPEKDRFELAMLLNNMLAAPAFQSWIEGEPLDIQSMLFLPDGRPRHNIFYIAHLSDSERMFFVTLLYSSIESWMRAQPGSLALRLLVYFDEIFGYLPPISNPPSKMPMLRMLKQARAFGVGQVLVTQNPVDLDYKGLSNAGTWFIGKLQTEQDKARLLDGLSSALGGLLERGKYDRLISSLGKRVFLLHNVHNAQPLLFQTRWAMNYLAGPLTRVQIPELNRLAGVGAASLPPAAAQPAANPAEPPLSAYQAIPVSPPQAPPAQAVPGSTEQTRQVPAAADSEMTPGSLTRPTVPAGVREYFLPHNLTFTQAFKAAGQPMPPQAYAQGLVYHPVIIAQAQIRFLERKMGVDQALTTTALVPAPDRRGAVRWEDYTGPPLDGAAFDLSPTPQARFTTLELPFTEARLLTHMQRDFLDWAYHQSRLVVRANQALGLYAPPGVTQAEFRQQCAEAARQRRDAELEKLNAASDKKFRLLQIRYQREIRDLESDETELSQRRMEEMGTHAENFFSLFSKRKSRLSTSLTKRRLTEQARSDVKESRQDVESLKQQMEALEEEHEQAAAEIQERWGSIALETTEITLVPYKKDVLLDLFGVAWMPYHVIQVGQEQIELPGFMPQAAQS